MFTRVITLLWLSISTCIIYGQSEKYKILTIGFYNLENFFDIENDPKIKDDDFTPKGKFRWTEEKYREKLANMAYAISQIGININPLGVSILGISEVENRNVLEELVHQESIKDKSYQIIHYDSPDRRGMDVALLYNPLHFTPIRHDTIAFRIYNGDGSRRFTRNILMVEGILDGDKLYILVNHWPSRLGGQKRSEPDRIKGAKLCREYVDSILIIDSNNKIIIMGDFNDNPNNASIKDHLKTKGNRKHLISSDLYNPMVEYIKRDQGSNVYRDSWSLFDQIILSQGLLNEEQEGYFYYKAFIFNSKFLVQPTGKYKDHPFRTFDLDTYQSGFSDHFPVYVHLLKKWTEK